MRQAGGKARKTSDWAGNIIALVLALIVNAMATSLPLGGQTPPEISAKYPSLFTPAGFTFAIWGVIYLLLLVFTIYQALPGQRSNATLARIDVLFKANCVANAAWLVAWHYDYLLTSMLIMIFILATLTTIYRALDSQRAKASSIERWVLYLPFSVYTAWICVAAIANISIIQNAFGWDNIGTDTVTWTLAKLALAGAIGASMIVRKNDLGFILVIAWAAYGIAAKQVDVPAVWGAATSLCIAAILLALMEMSRRLYQAQNAPHT